MNMENKAERCEAKLNCLKRICPDAVGFRGAQDVTIDAMLDGRDVFAAQTTGSGKTVCFVTAIILREGTGIIIEPTLALISEKVADLRAAGFNVARLDSTKFNNYAEIKKGLSPGEFDMVIMTPEQLSNSDFLDFAKNCDISVLVVDEAHCISSWGHSFREEYLRIGEFIDCLPVRPVVAAFTGTAAPATREEIISSLGMRTPFLAIESCDRPNISITVSPSPIDEKLNELREYISKHPGEKGMVYCTTKNDTERVCGQLKEAGVSAEAFHSGVDHGKLEQIKVDFQNGKTRVLAMTSSFSMGVNILDVRYVYFYGMPFDTESFWQIAGRAGRDGLPAECYVACGENDKGTTRWIITKSEDGCISDCIDRLDTLWETIRKDSPNIRERMLQYLGEKRVFLPESNDWVYRPKISDLYAPDEPKEEYNSAPVVSECAENVIMEYDIIQAATVDRKYPVTIHPIFPAEDDHEIIYEAEDETPQLKAQSIAEISEELARSGYFDKVAESKKCIPYELCDDDDEGEDDGDDEPEGIVYIIAYIFYRIRKAIEFLLCLFR